jgi:predicted RecA/RadA family phage recombinase
MSDKRKADEPINSGTEQDQDTEGHFMLPDTGAARILSGSRSRDIEREARMRLQKKESRPNVKRDR